MSTPAEPDAIAFELRDAYADNYDGGLLNVDGEDYDPRAALDDGDGIIEVPVANYMLIDALDQHPALKRLGADEPKVEVDRSTLPLDKLNKDELIARADTAGVDLGGATTKADILAALTANSDNEGGDQ